MAFVGLGLLPASAFAGDSTWLVCRGAATVDHDKAYLVANVFEHRAHDGQHRDLEVILIRGAVESHATVDGKKVGDVLGRSVPVHTVGENGKPVFDGTAKVSLGKGPHELALDGKLDRATVGARLDCEELDDQAIGH